MVLRGRDRACRRRAINVSTIFTPDCLRINKPLPNGFCRQPQAWGTHPLQGPCVHGLCRWHLERERVGLCFGEVGAHARSCSHSPARTQPAWWSPASESAGCRPGKGSRVVVMSSDGMLLPATNGRKRVFLVIWRKQKTKSNPDS